MFQSSEPGGLWIPMEGLYRNAREKLLMCLLRLCGLLIMLWTGECFVLLTMVLQLQEEDFLFSV